MRWSYMGMLMIEWRTPGLSGRLPICEARLPLYRPTRPSSEYIVLKELHMLLYFTSSNSGVRCMIALCIRILTTQMGFVIT